MFLLSTSESYFDSRIANCMCAALLFRDVSLVLNYDMAKSIEGINEITFEFADIFHGYIQVIILDLSKTSHV